MDKEKKEVKRYEKQDNNGVLDRLRQKVVSRKLLVFGLSTYFVIAETITSDQWVYIALVYIGSEAMANIFSIAKGNK